MHDEILRSAVVDGCRVHPQGPDFPLADQKLAGVVMMVEQALTLGTALVVLLLGARRARATAPRATPEPV